MGSQTGSTPSSSSSVSTPGPSQSGQMQPMTSSPWMTSMLGNAVGAGFGGMNQQSLQNQAGDQQQYAQFMPPQQPFQQMDQRYMTDSFMPMQMMRHRMMQNPGYGQGVMALPHNTGFVPSGTNPVLEQQQQAQAAQAQAQAGSPTAEESKLSQGFYSWGNKGGF